MAKLIEPKAIYTAVDHATIYDNQLKLALQKRKKISNTSDIARIAAPKGAQIMYNALRVGPRIILRSAFELLRANTITRLISVVVLLSIDTVSLIRGRISKKQFFINIVLALMILVGGTAGWVLGQELVTLVLLENVALGILAGIIGAGLLGGILSVAWEKIVKIFIRDDSEDMMNILNEFFAAAAQESKLTAEEIEAVKEKTSITAAVLRDLFIDCNRSVFASNLIKPHITEVVKRRGYN